MSDANAPPQVAEDLFTITLPRSAWLTVAHILERASQAEVGAICRAMTAQVEQQTLERQAPTAERSGGRAAPVDPSRPSPSSTH